MLIYDYGYEYGSVLVFFCVLLIMCFYPFVVVVVVVVSVL